MSQSEPTSIQPVCYRSGILWVLDQRALPHRERWLRCETVEDVATAIQSLAVRGAPAIGIAAAYGVALAARRAAAAGMAGASLEKTVQRAIQRLRSTRPTAVNLGWALERMARRYQQMVQRGSTSVGVAEGLEAEAQALHREDEEMCRRMAAYGAELLPAGARVLTHCNTGALATGGYGTALGVIRAAWQQGRVAHVWVDETRPVLQGARLTAWELGKEGIPHTLIVEGAAAAIMGSGQVDAVLVGADRVAANGDTANKIGTYMLAVLAHHHGIPFYVVAPWSTVDRTVPAGDAIPIEQRDPREVRGYGEILWALETTPVANPAFDITPAELITAIVTDRGVLRPPYGEAIVRCAATGESPASAAP